MSEIYTGGDHCFLGPRNAIVNEGGATPQTSFECVVIEPDDAESSNREAGGVEAKNAKAADTDTGGVDAEDT